jgi:hypothetical protein
MGKVQICEVVTAETVTTVFWYYSRYVYHTTRRHIPEDSNLHTEIIRTYEQVRSCSPCFASVSINLLCLIRDGRAWECHVKPHVSRQPAYVRCGEWSNTMTWPDMASWTQVLPEGIDSSFDRLIFLHNVHPVVLQMYKIISQKPSTQQKCIFIRYMFRSYRDHHQAVR